MDYLQHINNIILKLKDANELENADRVTFALRNSFMSTELLSSVTHELLEILKEDDRLKSLIGTDVILLKAFCASIGIKVW